MKDKIFKVKPSIAFVYNYPILDVFFSNTREGFKIEIPYEKIIDLIFYFDGKKTVYEVYEVYEGICDFSYEEFLDLVSFLFGKMVFIECDCCYLDYYLESSYRKIGFFEDYFSSMSEVILKISDLENKTVFIAGMGAVGTWVAEALVRFGVKNLVIADDDVVELSNLHRQNLFFERDVGKFKVDVVADRVNDISECNVVKIKKKVDGSFFFENFIIFDLVINCADFPSVDYVSKLISEYCMINNIPHIIGGGYNLHLSLVGQTVIPYETACYKCFERHLNYINKPELEGVKKLNRKNRKIGSFSPLCTVSASLTSLDAIKILIGVFDKLNNVNKRIEFITSSRDFRCFDIFRDQDCDWCGEKGIYKNGRK